MIEKMPPIRRSTPSERIVRDALQERDRARRARRIRLWIGIMAGVSIACFVLALLAACGPDQFTTKCNNDGGVEHVDKDKQGHPTERICTKGGHVIHRAPLPTSMPEPQPWQ